MDTGLLDIVEKYGPDVFLFTSQYSLGQIINFHPAPGDDEWAALLCNSKDATRKAVLGLMNRLRREAITAALEGATPASSQEIYELLVSARISENDFSDSALGPSRSREAGMSDAALSAALSMPFNLYDMELDAAMSRWGVIVHICDRLGMPALDPLLDAEMDATSRSLLRLAMLCPAARGFDEGVPAIRDAFLGEVQRKYDAMSATVAATGDYRDVEVETLKSELETLLGAAVELPSGDSDDTGCLSHDRFSPEMAQQLLGLLIKAKNKGILSLESSLSRMPSFLAKGLQCVCDGFAPEETRHWTQGKQAYLLEEARRCFGVVASACWSLAAVSHRSIGYALMASNSAYDLDGFAVRECIEELEKKAPRVKEELIPPLEEGLAAYGMSPADDSYADPVEWFELKMGLEKLASGEPLPDTPDFLAKLALILPPHRWKELEAASVLPDFGAAEVFAYALDLVLNGTACLPVAAYLMNLVKNLGPEAAGTCGAPSEFCALLTRLHALAYTDALLLPPEVFAEAVQGLTPPQVNALAHSAFGRRAAELGLELHKSDAEVVQREAAQYALLTALARLVVQGKWTVEGGVAQSEPVVSFTDGNARPPKEWLVEELEVDEDDIFSTSPDDCFTFEPHYGLFAVAGFSLADGADVFRRLPEATVADMLCCGVNNAGLETVLNHISSLDRKSRIGLRKLLAAQCKEYVQTYEPALSLGFEEVMGLPDSYIREWLRGVSNEDLVQALARAPQEFTDRVLGNLSERAAEDIAKDVRQERSRLDPAEEFGARMRIVVAARGVDPECEIRAAEMEKELGGSPGWLERLKKGLFDGK